MRPRSGIRIQLRLEGLAQFICFEELASLVDRLCGDEPVLGRGVFVLTWWLAIIEQLDEVAPDRA